MALNFSPDRLNPQVVLQRTAEPHRKRNGDDDESKGYEQLINPPSCEVSAEAEY